MQLKIDLHSNMVRFKDIVPTVTRIFNEYLHSNMVRFKVQSAGTHTINLDTFTFQYGSI